MDEKVALQINTRMIDIRGTSATAEENKVARLKMFTTDVVTIFLVLLFAITLQLDAIDIAIDIASKTAAIRSAARSASIAIRSAQPTGTLKIQRMRVVLLNIKAKENACTCQLPHLVVGTFDAMTGAVARAEQEQQANYE